MTDRYGDQVLAFGHPFLGIGPIRVPMATAEVVTVLSNQYSSFKISNLGDEIGAFEQDRQAGIQGRLGQKAPMIPMVVRISGGGSEKPREFHMRLADVPLFIRMLVGSTVVAAWSRRATRLGPQGHGRQGALPASPNYGDLEIGQSFDGDNAGGEVGRATCWPSPPTS